MNCEEYRKKYMRICSICEEEKTLEEMASDKICKQCNMILEQAQEIARNQIRADKLKRNFQKFKESVRCAET